MRTSFNRYTFEMNNWFFLSKISKKNANSYFFLINSAPLIVKPFTRLRKVKIMIMKTIIGNKVMSQKVLLKR